MPQSPALQLTLNLPSLFGHCFLLPVLFHLAFLPPAIHGQVLFLNTTVVPSISWQPPNLGPFRVGDERTVWLLVDSNETSWSGPVEITCEWALGCPLEECSIVHQIQLDKSNGFTQKLNLTLRGTFVGLNRLFAMAGRKQFWYRIRTCKTPFGSTLTHLFTLGLGLAVFTGNFMAGLQLDPWLILKYPKPLAAAILCQFLFVPMIGFCMAKYLLLGSRPFVARLALFLATCTPAGAGKGTFWSVLFDGNLELVPALSLVQRIGTLLFMPLWLHLLGHRAFFVDRVHIPWSALGYGLGLMAGPYLLGMLLTRIGARELLQRGVKVLKVLLWLGTFLFLLVAIPAVWPNLRLLTWDLLLHIGLFLPCAAHFVAFSLARIFGLNEKDAKTVVIECGIQSSGVSALILLLSLGEPERDVALAVFVGIALLTDKPLLALCLGRIGHRALAILKGAQTNGTGDKVAPSETDGPKNGQSNLGSASALSISSQQIAELLEQKLIRVRQVDELELAKKTTTAKIFFH